MCAQVSTGKSLADATTEKITIRSFATAEEMRVCVELQRTVWRFSDLDVVPHRMFVVASRTGGQVIGAFDGDRAIGFLLGLSAHKNGELYIHSHMTAVLPEYQNSGIGRKLKLAQRTDALQRGINLIEWTFDPLQSRNAHFNIARLGAISREYLPNLYGQTSSPLHRGLPTDRLVAQWWIRSPRVAETLAGRKENASAEHEVSIPRNIGELSKADPEETKRLQAEIRQKFQRLFGESYAVSGFELNDQHGRYLLQHL
jgi:predicted GNAT superfamily acetyltransferase